LYLCAASFRSCAYAIEREREGERGRERASEGERGREREREGERESERARASERERDQFPLKGALSFIHVCVCVCVTHTDQFNLKVPFKSETVEGLGFRV
jgi:hypothetical protein